MVGMMAVKKGVGGVGLKVGGTVAWLAMMWVGDWAEWSVLQQAAKSADLMVARKVD